MMKAKHAVIIGGDAGGFATEKRRSQRGFKTQISENAAVIGDRNAEIARGEYPAAKPMRAVERL